MAGQHFYSRVPARVSLYNKRDGFDTFAKSSGLEREFLLGELSAVYMDKLDIHDPVRVRRGEIPTVYSQMPLSDGRAVQTAVGYLPLDFTGERSAYLAHSQILSDVEKAAVYASEGTDVFNPEMFITDISAFDITARNAAPNPALAEKPYIPHALTDPAIAMRKYNPEMMKSFIYAVLCSLCDGGRDVYFRLPTEDKLASREALGIINALMTLFPYEMRERLSFVSYISRPDSYPGFKLKCVGQACEKIPESRGAFYDFVTGIVTAQPAGLEQNITFAAFLYSLIENSKVRAEFHKFVSGIIQKYGYCINSVKAFGEIVFIFWQCSGLYVEGSILPNDESVARFLDIYEKYREGIIPPHRMQAYRCLARYSNAQICVPDPIFDRLSRLYPGECVPAKAVALDVLLKLIHVDLMRDRLFAFINRYYEGEIDRVKRVINGNLCRVFYGGFLQQKILYFFDLHWRSEPTETRDLILDKLILSIRTPEIQRQIVAFLEKYYETMNDGQKMKICNTCLEMLPECDMLSVLLVGLINRRIGFDKSEFSAFMAERLTELTDAFIKAGDPRLCAIFTDNSGFCEDVVIRHIFGQRMGSEMLIKLLASMPAHKRAAKLLRIYKIVPELGAEGYAQLIGSLATMPVNILPSTMYDLMAAESAASTALPSELLSLFCSNIIYPAVTQTLFDVFKVKLGKDGIGTLLKYAEGREAITSSKQYAVVLDYIEMTKRCLDGDVEGAFKIASSLPESSAVRQDISEHIRMCSLDTANQSELTTCIYELLINYLKSGNFRFDAIYSKYRKRFEALRREEENAITAKLDPSDRRGAADAAEMLLLCVSDICDVSGELAEAVCDPSSGLKKALSEFFGIYGIGARVFLKKHFEDGYFGVADIFDELVEERNSSISSVSDAVDLVLRRKI